MAPLALAGEIGSNGSAQVLEALLSGRAERDRDLSGELIIGLPRNQQSSRRAILLQSCCDIHTVSEDVIAICHDIAEVNAEPYSQLVVHGAAPIPREDSIPNGDGAPDGVDDRSKLGEHAVAHVLDDPTIMRCHGRDQDIRPERLQVSERSCLVCFHAPRIAHDISRQDADKFALGRHCHPAPIQPKRG